ncbi:MAG: class IV adenylate cyclase [Anaerolineales bacterium]|jgi:adenylate cyclase class 2
MKEIEAKFYISRLDALLPRLTALGAKQLQPRALETNLRFDTPDGDLDAAHQILRLRQYHTVTLTYKSAATVDGGVSERVEIETEVGDFETVRQLLEALSYRVSAVYEKYRAMYLLGEVMVTLDELPYGDFVEIEGTNVATIREVAEALGLNWAANITDNYLLLMRRLPGENRNMLTFEAFEGKKVTPEELEVIPADAAE